MALVLKVMTAGDCSLREGESRSFDGASVSIGRGAENDWPIVDPQRHLSKQHCRIERRGNAYFVIDTSTNGVYIGSAASPLGRGNAQPLADGDTISLGPCVFKVDIRQPAVEPAPGPLAAFEPAGPDFPTQGAAVAYGSAASSVTDILGGRKREPAPLGAGADLGVLDLAETDMAAFTGAPPTSSHFAPPPVQRAVIPPDWHADDEAEAPAGEAMIPDEPMEVPETAIVRPTFKRPSPRTPEPVVEPAAAPEPAMAEEPAAPVVEPAAKPVAGPVPQDPVEAFLAGVGLPVETIDNADPAALMHKMGLAFREAVGGLRELLELRAFLKSEFRIEHTLLRAKENNPLKFSANLDGTLAVLIGKRVTGFMDAPEAVRESLRDIKAHEVALIAGMKTVVGDVLEQLSPETVSADVSSSLLPQVHKARCWEKYEQTHQRIMSEQSSGPPLGSKFSAAYTKQFRSL